MSLEPSPSGKVSEGEGYVPNWNKEIGKGAFSAVYEGRTLAGRRVAVKFARNRREIEAAKNEVALLRKFVGVENIVQWIGNIYQPPDNDRAGGAMPSEGYSFAMEYALYSLEEMMRNPMNMRGLHMDTLTDLICDCASALGALHEKKVAHRDIKHMNILAFPGFPTNGRRSEYLFKLCDLGGARVMDEKSDVGMHTLVGTPNMLHPNLAVELCRQHDWRTQREYSAEQCDLWSLGCTLYFCATGKFPFPHDNSDRQLYYRAVSAVAQNPDAIAVEYKGQFRSGVTGHVKHNFEPINEIPSKGSRYPKWFVHVLSAVIRGFFHDPSLVKFQRIASSLRTATRRVFLSVDQLSVVHHADLSQDPHVGFNFPTVSSCFGYTEGTRLMLISLTSMMLFEATEKSLKSLKDEYYFVVPICSEVALRRVPAKTAVYNESSDRSIGALIETRRTMIYDGLKMLSDVDEIIELVSEAAKILSRQFDLLVSELIREPEIMNIVSRFAVYSETACVPMIILQDSTIEDKEMMMKCQKSSERITQELKKHIQNVYLLAESCRRFGEETLKIKLVDVPLPGIKEELCSFESTDRETIVSTHEYAQLLVQQCLNRRSSLLSQMFQQGEDGRNVFTRLMQNARTLVDMREKYNSLQCTIADCTTMLEQPFQLMKSKVNEHAMSNGVDKDSMRRSVRYQSPAYQDKRNRVKEAQKTTFELAQELEKQLSLIGPTTSLMMDSITITPSSSLSTGMELNKEASTVPAEETLRSSQSEINNGDTTLVDSSFTDDKTPTLTPTKSEDATALVNTPDTDVSKGNNNSSGIEPEVILPSTDGILRSLMKSVTAHLGSVNDFE